MQITALHAAVRGHRAFRRAFDPRKRTVAIRALGAADMDLIGVDWLIGFGVNSRDARETFLRRHDRHDVEKPEPRRLAGRPFNAIGIGNVAAKHLVAAAEAEHMSAVAVMRENVNVPALRPEKSKIAARRFGAR